jgi:hypothetical protein
VADALNQSVHTIHLATTSVGESEIKQRIRILLKEGDFFNQVREGLQQEPNKKKYEGCQLSTNGSLLYNNRSYVPNSVDPKHLIMDEFHRRPYVGNTSYKKTITMVRKLYYWSIMKQYIVEYISKCLECQQVKVEHKHLAGVLKPFPFPEWKWETISMDFITGLMKTVRKHDSIMVVVDNLSKETQFIPIKSTLKAIDVVDIFVKDIFRLHGLPRTIISYRDEKFTSSL